LLSCYHRISTPVFVDPEISTQADGAQSSRVPVLLLEDPYEAIRQVYLVGTDAESEPFEDLVETEAPESPHTVAPPTSLPDSTPPTLVPILSRTARMAVRVPSAMSPGLSASMAEVAAMFDSAFCKSFRSSGDEEGDNKEEDEEMKESLDSDSVSEDAEGEGPTVEDEDPTAGDEDLVAGDKGPGIRLESLSLGGDEVIPEGQPQAAPVVETAIDKPLGLGYGALRRREIALGEGRIPSVFEVGQSSRSVPDSERPEIVLALREPTLTTWMDPEDGIVYIDVPAYPPPAPPAQTPHHSSGPSPTMAETEGFLTELGAQVEMQGGLIHDHTVRLEELSPALFERYDRDIGELFTRSGAVRDKIFSQRYRFRSLEHEHERVAVTFGAIWRPVLALESWAGQTDAQRAAL
ncbi:hypothetical protein Tco_1383321, partial [Tanacetum coccineum]